MHMFVCVQTVELWGPGECCGTDQGMTSQHAIEHILQFFTSR